MEKYTDYMDNNMICITINEQSLPVVTDCGILTASESFYHIDRTADFNVMIYVTDGVMYVTEDGRDYEIASGEILFLKKGLRHFGKYKTQRGTRWIYAHFYLPPEETGNDIVLGKKISFVSESVIDEKLYKFCELFQSANPVKKIRKNAAFYDILLDIASEPERYKNTLADQICSYLDGQTDKNFSKELIGNRFFLSYSYLSAEFKREKGISMGEYHNDRRMSKACRLLSSTLMSVNEISDYLGFADALYFSRRFRAFSGVSPTVYRKNRQKKY